MCSTLEIVSDQEALIPDLTRTLQVKLWELLLNSSLRDEQLSTKFSGEEWIDGIENVLVDISEVRLDDLRTKLPRRSIISSKKPNERSFIAWASREDMLASGR